MVNSQFQTLYAFLLSHLPKEATLILLTTFRSNRNLSCKKLLKIKIRVDRVVLPKVIDLRVLPYNRYKPSPIDSIQQQDLLVS